MKKIVIFLIWLYQKTISPILSIIGVNCRYYPTCSEYSKIAFKKYGFLKALKMSVKRVLSCNPWGGTGVDNP